MAGINDERLRMMEDEMNRFEEEIGLPPLEPPPLPPGIDNIDPPKLVIGANTYDQVQQKLKQIEYSVPGDFDLPPPPPAPFFIPPQLQRSNAGPSSLPLPPPPPPPGLGPETMNIMRPSGPLNMGGPPGPINMGGPPGPPMNMGAPSMNMRGPPMNMGGPPMNMGGPPMNMGGPPMNMGGPPMNMGGPPTNMGGPPMNMGGPPMNMGGPPMNMGGPPMNMGGPPMNMGGPPMNMGGPPMNMGGPPMNMGGPPMNMGGPPMNMGRPPGPMNMGGPHMNMGGPPGPPINMGGPPGQMNMMESPSMMEPQGMGGPMMDMSKFPEKPKKKKPSVVLSATPQLYNNKTDVKKENTLPAPSGPELPTPAETITQKSTSKKKAKEMAAAVAASVVTQTIVQSSTTHHSQPGQGNSPHLNKKKDKNKSKKVRTAGGMAWEDPTLAEWEEDDFRLFCGDLGNDVTDELLIRTFSKYPSFLKAKVVRDKRTNKTKGFGFVSFKDPQDFIRANKEMNGRYVGSRPIKLRKSNWKNRSLEVVRKKEKEKAALIGVLTGA